jgi:hypothetical protein
MKFERVPIPAGTESVDPTMMMMLGGIAVAALLVAVSSPRVVALVALAGGAIAGGLMIG